MAQKVQDVVTPTPVTITGDRPIRRTATVETERSIGDVTVLDDGLLGGVPAGRDIVVRVLAEGRDPQRMTVGEVCGADVTCLTPDDDVSHAVALMRRKAIRRLPLVDDGGIPVGSVSMGDPAVEREERPALADVAAAVPNA